MKFLYALARKGDRRALRSNWVDFSCIPNLAFYESISYGGLILCFPSPRTILSLSKISSISLNVRIYEAISTPQLPLGLGGHTVKAYFDSTLDFERSIMIDVPHIRQNLCGRVSLPKVYEPSLSSPLWKVTSLTGG
jgi:hypothetical protein